MTTKCPSCDRECTEERVREKRDGSVLVKVNHLDDTLPPHYFHEWPNLSSFMYRRFPNDARRRVRK
jgi:hypothetical protein